MTTAPPRPLLELRGLYKSFGAVQVLHDVDLSVYAGEVTALVGDNGAGKSTLVKCVSGIYTADSGEFRFDGRPVTIHNPRDAAALGIEVVYQDLALCDNLDIVQNMFLGRERRRGAVLDEPSMEHLAAQTLAGLGVRTVTSVRQQVASLSGGQRQTVAIAKAVLWNSRVVILDEPTAALGVAQTAQVLELVRRLADNGLAVVLISHNMNDVFAVSDRIAALYLGRMVAQVKATDVSHSQVVELITAGRSGGLGTANGSDGLDDPMSANAVGRAGYASTSDGFPAARLGDHDVTGLGDEDVTSLGGRDATGLGGRDATGLGGRDATGLGDLDVNGVDR